MLIWKGWGIGAFIIPLAFALVMEFLADSCLGAGYYKAANWPFPLALLLSSIPLFILGFRLNKKPGRLVVDTKTNEKIELKTTHSLFWIPMQYWSLIIIGISVWIYLSNIGYI